MLSTRTPFAMSGMGREKKDNMPNSWDLHSKRRTIRTSFASYENCADNCLNYGKRLKLEAEIKEETSDFQLVPKSEEPLLSFVGNQSRSIIAGTSVKGTLMRALDENLLYFCQTASKAYSESNIFPRDRDKLLRQNGMLYLNFLLGRFLIASGEEDQLCWLKSKMSMTDLGCLKFDDANKFVASLQLLNQDKVLQRFYLGFAQSLSSCKIKPNYKENMAMALAFYPGRLELVQHIEIGKRFHEATMDLSNGEGHLVPVSVFHDICQTLEAMMELLKQSGLTEQLLWHHPLHSNMVFTLDFGKEEERWLFGVKDKTFAAMTSVWMSSDMIRNVYRYLTCGVPLPSDHLTSLVKLIRGRMLKTYLTHREFAKAGDQERNRIVRSSSKMLLALMLSLIDLHAHSIRQQGFLLLPSAQRSRNGDVLARRLMSSGLRGVSCRDSVPFLPAEWEDTCSKVHAGMRNPTDQDGMWLFALMSTCLFNNLSSGEDLGAVKKWLDASFSRRYGAEFESSIHKTFQDLRELSHLLPDNY